MLVWIYCINFQFFYDLFYRLLVHDNCIEDGDLIAAIRRACRRINILVIHIVTKYKAFM